MGKAVSFLYKLIDGLANPNATIGGTLCCVQEAGQFCLVVKGDLAVKRKQA